MWVLFSPEKGTVVLYICPKHNHLNPLKKLAGETAVYGLPSIVARLLNFLLVPIYVSLLAKAEYGVVTDLYSAASVLNVVLSYGMETAFFRFLVKNKDKAEVRNTAFTSLLLSSLLFILAGTLMRSQLAAWTMYSNHVEYITWFIWIIGLDALMVIPFAYLREQGKAFKFATIRATNIFINISLNLLLILAIPAYIKSGGQLAEWFATWHKGPDVSYIFISNLIANAITVALLLPQLGRFRLQLKMPLWPDMLRYGYPILIAGLAGVINETMDKQFLKYLLPKDIALAEVGVYGACYKLTMFMTLFIQAFRMGAEPFFFSYSQEKDARKTYAQIMKYFVIVLTIIYIGILGNMSWLKYFINNPSYWEGLKIVPVVLLANLFLGVYINLSVWYKLSDQTGYGARISIFGALVTIVINFLFIPSYSYMASAWATLAAYGSMMLISYWLGKKHYTIPYDVKKIAAYIVAAALLGSISFYLFDSDFFIGNALVLAFVLFVVLLERNEIKALKAK